MQLINQTFLQKDAKVNIEKRRESKFLKCQQALFLVFIKEKKDIVFRLRKVINSIRLSKKRCLVAFV